MSDAQDSGSSEGRDFSSGFCATWVDSRGPLRGFATLSEYDGRNSAEKENWVVMK